MVESNEFQLSRIYAQGWSAGRKSGVEDVSEINALEDGLNPCWTSGERERWRLGFTAGMARRQVGSTKRPSPSVN